MLTSIACTLAARIYVVQSVTQSLEATRCSHVLASAIGRAASFVATLRWCSTTSPTSVTTSASETSTEAHTSAEETHELREKSTTAPAATEASSSAHSSNVLALGLDCQLTSLEQ